MVVYIYVEKILSVDKPHWQKNSVYVENTFEDFLPLE